MNPQIAAAVEAVRALLGADADEVVCEITRSGTTRIVAKRGDRVVEIDRPMTSGMARRRG